MQDRSAQNGRDIAQFLSPNPCSHLMHPCSNFLKWNLVIKNWFPSLRHIVLKVFFFFVGSHGASGKHDSWGDFDSGARDLSPEPNTLHKLIEAAGGTISGCSNDLLELANKVSNLFLFIILPLR